jgi:co-chaperonin GroES (HSP10)
VIKPLGAMLLVKQQDSVDKTTKTGLVISAAFNDSGPQVGIVVDMGDGEANYKGDIIPISYIDIDDEVYYPRHSGIEIEDEDGSKYYLINAKNILAKKDKSV